MNDVRVIPRNRTDTLGEGLFWSVGEQALFWVDILSRRINRLSLSDDGLSSWHVPDVVGWVIEREQGGFVAGMGQSFVSLTLDPLHVQTIAAPEPDRLGNRFNDAKADAEGRIWAGSMPSDCSGATGALYRLDPEGTAIRVDDGFTIANGPAINNDILLHTDTRLRTIYRHTIRDDGSLSPRQPFIVFEQGWGDPDGMCFDADGHLWVACWGAGCVARFDADGRRERIISIPTVQVTNVAFGGAALDRMFVTSEGQGDPGPHAGALFEVDPRCLGTAPHRYAG